MAPKKEKTKPINAAAKAAQERLASVKQEKLLREEAEEKAQREELERINKLEEEERLVREAKEKKAAERKAKKDELKSQGKWLTPKQKQELKRAEEMRKKFETLGWCNTTDETVGDGKNKKMIKTRKKKKEKVEIVDESENESVNLVQETPIKNDVECTSDDWDASSNDEYTQEPQIDDVEKSEERTEFKKCETDEMDEAALMRPPPLNMKPKERLVSDELRAPICCILGHVDTGKTSLLDKIRRSNVQAGEVGGITQQIGASFFPQETLSKLGECVESKVEVKVPGLLIIDTPGHESFENLRSRGSSLCDIAILVVDLLHGLEPQTIESIELLKKRKCPFVIALNKIDRIYGWKVEPWACITKVLRDQDDSSVDEFRKRFEDTKLQISKQGLNCALYWENDDFKSNISVVPTSAVTGEGLPDLMMLLIKLTQNLMANTLMYVSDSVNCTVLEVREVVGLGTTIDVILIDGVLHQGDEIVVCGMNGAIVAKIRALLTPHPLKELRVKNEYIHHQKIKGAMGIKISAPGLDQAVAGTPLRVVGPDNPVEKLREESMSDMSEIFNSVNRNGEGVYVMASTLGSLEALLTFLKSSKIPVYDVNLGTVNKFDVKKASVMLEKKEKHLAVILAFDVKISDDAKKEADHLGVRIMSANIIYHLFDQFTKYIEDIKTELKNKYKSEAVFPCRLKIINEQHIYNKKDPLILGVTVLSGSVKLDTPVCVAKVNKNEDTSKVEIVQLGKVTSIEINRKDVPSADKGAEVAVKISGQSQIAYGRHFDYNDEIMSELSRDSIDILKKYFREDLLKSDWKCILDIKNNMRIQ
eukprot:GHVL01023949.1.p1 GENE.GHVL01023949.1~~GHVL01023949.1.p1  ORF type:complete len:819 (+),score=185.77 GHVL01023949.1:34-2490(+)